MCEYDPPLSHRSTLPLSVEQGMQPAIGCRFILVNNGIDTDVRSCESHPPPSLQRCSHYKPAIAANSMARLCELFATSLGLPKLLVCVAATSNFEGTGGYFTNMTQPGNL